MMILEGFALREIAENYIVVPVNEKSVNFNAMITLNETGAFLWKQLEDEKTEKQLLMAMLEEYNIDSETAKADISEFVEKLRVNGILKQ